MSGGGGGGWRKKVDWRKLVGGMEKKGGGVWRQLVGVWRKDVVIWQYFAPLHAHAQAAMTSSSRRPASQEPERTSTREERLVASILGAGRMGGWGGGPVGGWGRRAGWGVAGGAAGRVGGGPGGRGWYERSYSPKGCLYGGVKNALRNRVG